MKRLLRTWLSIAALGFAAFLWSAAPGSVLARGGGHGGGGHGGGGHGGGAHGGGRSGYSGGHYGGHSGGYYGGGRGYYGGYGGYGLGYGGYGLGYGLLGGYGLGGLGYGGYGGYGNGYGYGGGGYGYGYPDYNGGYNPGYYDNDSYGIPPYPAPAQQPAHLTVTVPANADVYFNGIKTQETGTVRRFVTPPLVPGNYQYDIRATWMENGQQQTQERQVTVHPGEDVAVNFRTAPARMAPQ